MFTLNICLKHLTITKNAEVGEAAQVETSLIKDAHRHLAVGKESAIVHAIPCHPRHTDECRQRETHVVTAYLIKRFVVHSSHELRLGWRSVGVSYVESPRLALSRCESIAEGCPFKIESGVGQRTLYSCRMLISLTVLYPRYRQRYAVAPLLFVHQCTCAKFVLQVGTSVFYHLVARNERIYNVLYGVARTHLYEHGCHIVLEAFSRLIEPVVCLHRSLAVAQ